jgi:hypothetical protein
MSYIKDATPHIIAEVTTLPTASSELEGMLVRKGDSIYLCRDSRWRKIYPPVNWGIDVPRLCGLKPQYIVWPRSTTTASTAPGNMRTIYVPITLPYGCVVSAISINVATAISGTNTLGIYDSQRLNDYYYPNNLLRSGTVNVSTTGFKTATFGASLELLPGELYFLALNNPLSGTYSVTGLSSQGAIGQYFGNVTSDFTPWCVRRTETSLPNPASTSDYVLFNGSPLFTLTLQDIFLY